MKRLELVFFAFEARGEEEGGEAIRVTGQHGSGVISVTFPVGAHMSVPLKLLNWVCVVCPLQSKGFILAQT